MSGRNQSNDKPHLIAIVGGSGAGKSWLAQQLEKAIGKKWIGRLSLDDFYKDRSHLTETARNRINFDHPRAINWRDLEKTMTACLANEPVQLPRYDFATHCSTPGLKPLNPKPLILIDGLWLLRRPSLRRLFSLSVFIECPAPLRLKRRVRRDARQRRRSSASVREQFAGTVLPMHERFVAPQARFAKIFLKSPIKKSDLAYVKRQVVALKEGGI